MESQTFRLFLPFTTQPQYDIGSPEVPAAVPVPGLTVTLAGTPGSYVLEADAFPSPEAAIAFIPRAWVGLASLMLDVKTGFLVNLDATEGKAVDVSPSSWLPPKFHGPKVIVDEGWPYIAPSNASLLKVAAGKATIRVTTGIDRAIAALSKGISHPRAQALFDNRRLRTAIDLFALAPFEERLTTRLVLLATGLEVLAPPIPKAQAALNLIDRWEQELGAALATYSLTSEEAVSLQALQRELIFRRDASIRTRIREYVRTTLASASVPDAEVIAGKAVLAYDARSTFVHDGALAMNEVGTAVEALRLTLERLFLVRFAAV